MSVRTVYHVEPEGDLWVVKLAGDSQSEHSDSKESAVARAKQLARRLAAAQVVVFGSDGRVEQEIYFDEHTRSA
jgi:hypothetical protein